jgi:hypothetical protein
MDRGGTAFLQIILRSRLIGPLHGEVGFLLLPPAIANGSAGLLVDLFVSGNLSSYAGAGAGFGFGAGDSPGGTSTLYFGLGFGYRFNERHLQIGVDAGAWYGAMVQTGGGVPTERDRILWPMGGVALLYEL